MSKESEESTPDLGESATAWEDLLDDIVDDRLPSSDKIGVGEIASDSFIALQRYHSLGYLSAELAHEFNDVMMTVLISIGLLQKLPGHDERQKNFLDRIHDAVLKASKSTARFIEYARPAPPEITAVDVNAVIREAFALIERRIPQKVLTHLELDPKLPLCRGNSRLLLQAILNGLLNAVESLPVGGSLLVTTQSRSGVSGGSHLAASPPGNPEHCIEISIRDNGQGPPDRILRDPFRPLQSTRGSGRGLGLAAAQAILKFHRGEIEIKADQPRGTRLTILLPAGKNG